MPVQRRRGQLALVACYGVVLLQVFNPVAGAAATCVNAAGDSGPCGPAYPMCGAPFGAGTPQFHVKDPSCGENDPNGPMYDPVHGMYHLFYQDHIAELQGGKGRGPDWGHAASKDLVHWAHLPVALWNDQWYDLEAVYTGSATIVDGKPVIVYPGICDPAHPSCDTGTALAIAVPADPSDPLYQSWAKVPYNPVVNNTQRDPSTAWQTPSGDWRLTTFTGDVYGSPDFKSWSRIGGPLFTQGECPSFYPLPRLVPGTKPPPGTKLPTHVHKQSNMTDRRDWVRVGTYVPGEGSSLGSWTATPGVTDEYFILDQGEVYASKDFYDPVKQRRINWGWAVVPPASTQTLPREALYHPVFQRILWRPLDEQTQLREDPLVSKSSVPIAPGASLDLGLTGSQGLQAEVLVTVPLGASPFNFSVDVNFNPADGSSTSVWVEYVPPASGSATVHSVSVGVSSTEKLGVYMQGTDLPGGDYNITNVNYVDPHTCMQACDADPKCQAWTYVVRPPLHASCCLKSDVPASNPNPTCTSGVRSSVTRPTGPSYTDVLFLDPSESAVDIRVFVDQTFVEAFWSGASCDGAGVAMTASLVQFGETSSVALSSSSKLVIPSVKVWPVSSIWVPPEHLLADQSE